MCESRSLSLDESVRLWRRFGACAMFAQRLRCPLQYTGPLSTLSDQELDGLIAHLRLHYPRAGITTTHGMLRRIGHRLSRERVRAALLRVDPVCRTFERIRIQRCTYRVAGPNALWHHDGQHGE